jgi:hypothetical protein
MVLTCRVNKRLANKTSYFLFMERSKALGKDSRIMNRHSGLDIAGEYGSIEIDDYYFVTG